MAAAYAALLSLMKVIHDIENHPSPPISLDKQLVESINRHAAFFLEFLQSCNPSSTLNVSQEAADPLEMSIAAAANTAEDAIEFYIADTIQQRLRSNSNANNESIESISLCRGRLLCAIVEMDSIKKVMDNEKKKKRKKEKKMMKKKKAPVVHHLVAMKNFPAPIAPNETMAGFDDVLLEIMEMLTGGRPGFQVIPIVGMGGMGKTFLAKTIYARRNIKDHFVICAWATISQNYKTREILCEVLSQATNINKEQLSGKSVDELGLKLYQYLFCRRFLIVMDDMWSIDPWDEIQRFFPNNENGSRVLVTTRLLQLSSQLNSDYSLRMSFLDEASSWDLFSKTVFGEKSCPPELKKIGEKIVDNCRGLPLSIVVVGGLLRKMDGNQASWESIRDNFTSVVNMENDKHCLRLLKLSYDHLPVYIKPCFLYMGVFEEDYEIRVSLLVRLWVSEGLLKPRNGEVLETTARGFLQDLIDRNLILVNKLGCTGSIKSCKIHDLVRDMCVKEGQKEGFYHVIGKRSNPRRRLQVMDTQRRRVVIPRDTSINEVGHEWASMRYVRSIISGYSDVTLSENMRLLRTLHSLVLFPRDKRNLKSLVFEHVNLRHLIIRVDGMTISSLPSLALLWNLHTLIVHFYAYDFQPSVFDDFWKMAQCRHIEFVGECHIMDPPISRDGDSDVVVMQNLQTLKNVRNFRCSERVAKRIPNIKKLKVKYTSNQFFAKNFKPLCRLESLSVDLTAYKPTSTTTRVELINFPHSLKKLDISLDSSSLEWDGSMLLENIGGSLPLLEKLKLYQGYFRKGKWETVEGQFPCLKYLKLRSCRGLKGWTAAEEGSKILPRLEHLRLFGLSELEKIPSEVGNIDTLRRIQLIGCRQGAVESAKEMVDEQLDLQGQLNFHVEVVTNQQHLLSLAGPNFQVSIPPKCKYFEKYKKALQMIGYPNAAQMIWVDDD